MASGSPNRLGTPPITSGRLAEWRAYLGFSCVKMVREIGSAAEFDQLLASSTYVMVDFFATWCPPCKQIAPFFESLDKKHSVDRHLQFAKVDVEKVREIAARYRVTAMPTFLFFKEGKQVAVNSNVTIRGADPRALGAAAEKLSGLAQKRVQGASA